MLAISDLLHLPYMVFFYFAFKLGLGLYVFRNGFCLVSYFFHSKELG